MLSRSLKPLTRQLQLQARQARQFHGPFAFRARTLFPEFNEVFEPVRNNAIPIDMVEEQNKYSVKASIPGATLENLKLNFDKHRNQLEISAEIPEQVTESNDDGYHYKEIKSGSLSRVISFGDNANIDESNIAANYKDGILHVSVPRTEPVATESVKEIPINS